MTEAIDVRRGVMIKRHRASGMQVYMYFDTPGVYLNPHGGTVSEELAAQAGFDTKQYAKERLRRDRMASAMSAIEAELALSADNAENVIEERDGFKIIELALGNANVVDEDGHLMNPVPIPVAQAKELLKHLAPQKVEDAPRKYQGNATRKEHDNGSTAS